ncbi:DUF3304 domain-containing protein [Montanilutibacter psychrotolerans]|uniref:DUF3304 domain-containing protein n=1 Tax=Montanilutibacter psychrotolerans TaxID=1327343 RepID=A0A3M8SQM2_9GAMM|nr:DUF3304 domain-containing protein [Lysobacter psychrotolerans]RNF83569.1 DUF3304 domain-containing protein [Lysobacter psychrotolerans]
MHWMKLSTAALLGLLLANSSGCSRPEPEQNIPFSASADDMIGFDMQGLNYTDVPIATFYVDDQWGGGVMPYLGGHSSAGAIGLPFKWRPGLKVKVSWQDDIMWRKDPNSLREVVLEVPKYERIYAGFLLIAFEPGGKVRVRASSYLPGGAGAPKDFPPPVDFCRQQPGCTEWWESNPIHAKRLPREGHY